MQQVQLNVSDEMKALGDAFQVLAADIVAKKPVAEIVSDSLADLIAALGGYSSMPADIQLADNEAYLVRSLKIGLTGK